MHKFGRYIFYIILFSVYIYSLIFVILPINSKFILEGVGLLASVPLFMKYSLKKEYIWVFRFIIIIVLWDMVVCIVNGTDTFFLTKAMVTPLGSVFGAQLLYMVTKKDFNNQEDFLEMVVITVLIESLISALSKFVPIVSQLESTLLVPTESNTVTDLMDHYRFVGIGNAVSFGVLPSFIIAVMSNVFFIARSKGGATLFFLYITYFIICIVSFFSARTSLFVIAVSLLLLFYYLRKRDIKKIIGFIVFFVLLIIVSISFIQRNFDNNMIEWALGFITNKDLDSGTAGLVISWWTETEFELKTFIVGDGFYTDPSGIGYYKGVDIGYFRKIFYGGIIGLSLMLYYHYRILWFAYKSKPFKDYIYLFVAMMVAYLLILTKGDTNMLSYFILIMVFFTGGIFNSSKRTLKVLNTRE